MSNVIAVDFAAPNPPQLAIVPKPTQPPICPDRRFNDWDYQAFRREFLRLQTDDLNSDLALSRPTQDAGEQGVELWNRMEWRRTRWGGVKLTPREYQALVCEKEAIEDRALQYRDLDRDVKQQQRDRIQHDLTIMTAQRVNERADYYERKLAEDLMIGRAKICKGVQAQIGREMGITQGRVSQLLTSAAAVLSGLTRTCQRSHVSLYDR